MAKCTVCSKVIEKGTGLIYIKKEGTIIHFCSSKCKKNMIKLRRKPGQLKWMVKKK